MLANKRNFSLVLTNVDLWTIHRALVKVKTSTSFVALAICCFYKIFTDIHLPCMQETIFLILEKLFFTKTKCAWYIRRHNTKYKKLFFRFVCSENFFNNRMNPVVLQTIPHFTQKWGEVSSQLSFVKEVVLNLFSPFQRCRKCLSVWP